MFDSIKEYLLNDTADHNAFHRTIFQIIVITTLTILVFLNIFQNKFVMDDTVIFLNWPAVKNTQIDKLLQGAYPLEFSNKVYRPVKGVIFATEYRIFKENTFFYHLQAIILNLAITLIIYFIIKKITKKSSIAFITSLIFGVHSLHTEAITFMTASLDTWGILFFFVSFYLYLRAENKKMYFLIPSLIFACLAFFTYELTLSLSLILILYDFCFKKISKKNLLQKLSIYSALLFLVLGFFALRLHFIGHLKGGAYFANSFYLTILAMIQTFVQYLSLFILPINLSINPVVLGRFESWTNIYANLDPIKHQSILDIQIIFSAVVIIFLIIIAFLNFKKRPIITFCIAWIFISLFPVLNIIPQGLLMAERYAYISSFGAILLLVYIFYSLYNYKFSQNTKSLIQNCLIVFVLAIVFIFSFLTIKRNMEWKDNFSIWLSTTTQSIGSLQADYVVADTYLSRKDFDNAIIYYKKAIDKNKKSVNAYYGLAQCYAIKGDLSSAEKAYYKILSINPGYRATNMKTIKAFIENSRKPNIIQNNSKYLLYKTQQNYSFEYLSAWNVKETGNEILIKNAPDDFWVEIKSSTLPNKLSVNDYLKSQTQTYGVLKNEGLAQIPTVDYAYAKIWDDNSTQKIQFFLFKDKNILEAIVFPADSSDMKGFDKIISSLKFY